MLAVLSPETINWLIGIPMGIYMILLLGWLVLVARFDGILSTKHPEIYERVTRPGRFLNREVINRLGTVRFLLNDHFRELNDPELLRLGNFLQVYYRACGIALIIAIAVTAAFGLASY